MEIILYDTDFLFECIHLNPDAVKYIDDNAGLIFTSVVTGMELIKSCPNKIAQNRLTTKHLSQFGLVPIEKEISDLAFALIEKYHLSHNLTINDAFVAATAIEYTLPLATCNQADFTFIPDLKIVKHNVKPKRRGGSLFSVF